MNQDPDSAAAEHASDSTQVSGHGALIRGLFWGLMVGVIGLALVFSLAGRAPHEIRIALMYLSPRALALNLVLVLAALAACVPLLQRRFHTLDKRLLIALALLPIVGTWCSAFIAPMTHRIYFDEQIYQDIGINIALDGDAAMPDESHFRYGEYDAVAKIHNKQPNAWPYLLSLVFRLVGLSEDAAFFLNNVLFGLGVLLVCMIVRLLFADWRAGFFAAGIYLLIPLNLQWANTTSAELSAAVSAAAAVCACATYVRTGEVRILFLTTVLTAFAVQFRPESLLILPVQALLIILHRPRSVLSTPFLKCMFLFVLLVIPHILHLYSVRGEGWGSSGEKFSSGFLLHNLIINGAFYWTNVRFPVLFTLFAVAGIFSRGRLRERAIVLVWFGLFWGIFLTFYAGSYNYGADVRFSVLSYAPISVLAGYGASRIANTLARLNVPASGAVVAIVAALAGVAFLPLARTTGEEAWAARADQRFVDDIAPTLPNDAIVYSHAPCLFHMHGLSAAQLHRFPRGRPLADLERQFPGGAYLHWGYWCVIDDPSQSGLGHAALEAYECELVAEHQEREYTFKLYRILKQKGASDALDKAPASSSAGGGVQAGQLPVPMSQPDVLRAR